MPLSQCPECGATFRPGAAACPECGIELYDADPAADDAAQEKLSRIVAKVQFALRPRFGCNDETGIADGFLFTDPADGVTYELHVREFDSREWASR